MKQKGFTLPIILLIFLIATVAFILGNLAPKLNLYNKIDKQPKINTSPSPVDKLSSIPDIEPILIPYLTQDLKFWYQNDYSIYNSTLDGKNQKKVVEGTKFDQLSAVRVSKDGNTIYYITIPEQNKVSLFKKSLNEDKTEKLLEIDLENNSSGMYYKDFSISHNEKLLAFTGKEGLWIYSLIDKSKKLLLKNRSFSAEKKQGGGGFSYHYPLWSYNDSRVALERSLYEGADSLIIDANNGDIIVKDLLPGEKNWSYSENQLLIAGSSYGGGGLFLVKDKAIDLLASNLDYKNLPIVNAQISQGGNIIFLASGNINLFNTKENTFKTLIKNVPDNIIDFLWLPDNHYVYVRNETGDVWFVRLDGLVKVKIPIQADRLIAVF